MLWWLPWLVLAFTKSPRRHTDTRTVPSRTLFEQRMVDLASHLRRSTGRRVLIAGQPGAGKSTLVDEITDRSCNPRPLIGTNTDATDWSREGNVPLWHVYDDVMIVDSPGLGTDAHPAASFVRYMPWQLFDLTAFVVRGKLHQADDSVLHALARPPGEGARQLVVLRSCAEDLRDSHRREVMADIGRVVGRPAADSSVRFVSARTGEGLGGIRDLILGGRRDLDAHGVVVRRAERRS